MLLSIGPGMFCIGYTIGTGSVTTMTVAGSKYGTKLLWVLAASCLFSGVMMEAYGRYAVVTGETAIHSFKTRLKGGKIWAVLTLVGIVLGQWCCFSGLVGLSANAVYEGIQVFLPSLSLPHYWSVLGISIGIMIFMYSLLLVGRYSFFEKVLIFFVTILGLSFFLSMFIVLPSPTEIVKGLIPTVPKVEGTKIMVAAFVGTTMAAPTFVVRPLLMKGKGWTIKNLHNQTRDAAWAALLMFLISGSIMVCSTGALFHHGIIVDKVLDMVHTLHPIAGKYAVCLFIMGILSAGLSSIMPVLMIAPLLVADYREGSLDTRSRVFRGLAALACVMGLLVPIFGANPIIAQIVTQVSQVFILPLVVGGILYLINQKKYMGKQRAGILLNAGMFTAFCFSCIMSYLAIKGLAEYFSSIT